METRGHVGFTYWSTSELFCSQAGNQVHVSQPCSPARSVVIRLNYHVNGSLIFTKVQRAHMEKSVKCFPVLLLSHHVQTTQHDGNSNGPTTQPLVHANISADGSSKINFVSVAGGTRELGESKGFQPKLIITLEFLLLICFRTMFEISPAFVCLFLLCITSLYHFIVISLMAVYSYRGRQTEQLSRVWLLPVCQCKPSRACCSKQPRWSAQNKSLLWLKIKISLGGINQCVISAGAGHTFKGIEISFIAFFVCFCFLFFLSPTKGGQYEKNN